MYPIKADKLIITSKYGKRQFMYQGKLVRDFHHGIDLFGRTPNDEVVAIADGIVTSLRSTGKQYGYSCYVRIKHPDGLYSLYVHMKTNTVCVRVGQHVKKGQTLGIIGTTGRSTGVHLHFQIDHGSSATSINPYDYVFGTSEIKNNTYSEYSDTELARMVIAGKFGNGKDRVKKLKDRYPKVQELVNKMLSNKGTLSEYTDKELAERVIAGKFGNGQERKNKLKERYAKVQALVNKMLC